MIDLAVPRRQSVWAVAFRSVQIIQSIGIAQAAVAVFFVFTRGIGWWLFAVVTVAGIALVTSSILSWLRFTFALTHDEFVVTSGVLRLDRRSIPIARVQSVSIERDLLHRLVGVVRLSLDTAGSAATEFQISAVSGDVADALQRRIDATPTIARQASELPAPTGLPVPDLAPPDIGRGRLLLAHSPRRLVVAALTSWPWGGLAILAPLAAFRDQLGEVISIDIPTPDLDRATWWWIPSIVATVVALSVVLNTVRMLLNSWGLTVHRDGSGLRRSAGLLSTRLDTRGTSKVQVVSSGSNPLQRAVGLAAVDLSSVGDGTLDVIGCDHDEIDLIADAVGLTSIDRLDPQRRIHPAQVFLAARNSIVVSVMIGAAAWFVVGWWALLAAGFAVVASVRAVLHVRHVRWAVTGSELAVSGRVIDSWTRQTLLRKINGVRLTRSMFQRRRDLATVTVQTAAGSIEIGMLALDEAHALRDHLLTAVLVDDGAWI